MTPFENIYEVFTFISLFAFAVIGIPYIFIKIGTYYEK